MSATGAAASTLTELANRASATLELLRQARDVTVGCSAKDAVWRHGKTTLYRYRPLTDRSAARDSAARATSGARRQAPQRPVLICFALVNRPYVLDLQPDRSLIRRLLEANLTVYLIDWGDPDEADRGVDLD